MAPAKKDCIVLSCDSYTCAYSPTCIHQCFAQFTAIPVMIYSGLRSPAMDGYVGRGFIQKKIRATRSTIVRPSTFLKGMVLYIPRALYFIVLLIRSMFPMC